MLYLFPHYFKTKLKIIEAGKVNKSYDTILASQLKKVNIMKKLLLIVIGALVISACANKDVYFNGSEGSHSGIKFDKDTRHWGVNQ